LGELGVTPESVVLIIATHWHDDHIRGLATVLEWAPTARFGITSAFGKKDFKVALAPWLDDGSDLDGKGLSELRRIIKLGRQPTLVGENKILFEHNQSPRCQVLALSPSDASVITCISELSGIPRTRFRTRMPDMQGNHASVVLSIEVEGKRLLLGGDLQVRADRRFGWLAVVDNHRGFGRPKHHVYKIPHHGSENADHAEIWAHLLEPEPHAVVAPFVGGKTKLPTNADCDRISRATRNAFLTAPATGGKFEHPNRSVLKTMREATRALEVVHARFGQVRLRGLLNAAPQAWSVDLFVDAVHL